jgi:hypothetical protein
MRRVLLVLPLAVAAFVLAPMATANAATVSGACTVSGQAHFTPTGLKAVPGPMTYDFTGSGTCNGTLDGNPITNAPVSAHAAGAGTLSCLGAASTGGSGTLTFPAAGNVTVGFGISLVGTGSEVTFVLTGNGGGAGVGHATFAANATRAPECNTDAGLNDLGFDIQAAAANLAG